MKMGRKFSVIRRIYSFKHAFKGIKVFLATQHNAWVQLIILAVVIAAGFYLHLHPNEWIAVLLASGLVLVSEVLNTSIEYLTDYVSPDYHEQAGKVKDLGAAAVLVAAIIAFIIGCIVFIPKIIG